MIMREIAHSEMRHEPISGRQLEPRVPLRIADGGLRDVLDRLHIHVDFSLYHHKIGE